MEARRMPVQPLLHRIGSLPLILAGPILRRVEPEQATVWVALRKPRKVRLEVYARDQGGSWATSAVLAGEATTVQLGPHLPEKGKIWINISCGNLAHGLAERLQGYRVHRERYTK